MDRHRRFEGRMMSEMVYRWGRRGGGGRSPARVRVGANLGARGRLSLAVYYVRNSRHFSFQWGHLGDDEVEQLSDLGGGFRHGGRGCGVGRGEG
jgi:hypothetical protein